MQAEYKSKKALLLKAIKTFSYRENYKEPFKLASGKTSPYYFDLKQTLLQPYYLQMAASLITQLINDTSEKPVKGLAGLTMGADPIIYASVLHLMSRLNYENDEQVTQQTVWPVVIRKASKEHGSKKRAEGLIQNLKTGDRVVLIDDVITTGKSTLEAFEVMKQAGFQITEAFCIVDRKEGGAQNLLEHGVKLVPVFELQDFKESN